MLVEMGYTITDGDRPTGFIRGERQRLERGGLFFDQLRRTDILMVSVTAFPGSGPQLNVTASRWRAPTQSAELDEDGHTVRTWQHGGEDDPSDEALADARQLLGRCAGGAVAQS